MMGAHASHSIAAEAAPASAPPSRRADPIPCPVCGWN